MSDVSRVERGWAGHFICADRCTFHRNTLLRCGDVQIVVSTVGLMRSFFPRSENRFEEVGHNRFFETMAFHALRDDTRYHDADVTRQICFESEWAISETDADDKANDMHEAVVAELTAKLERGEILDEVSA